MVSPSVVDEWNTIIRNTTTAIREIAPDTYIVFGGVKYNNVTSVPLLIEPFADKLVYNFHCYDPFVFTHQKAYWVEGMPKDFEMSYPGSLELYREKSALFAILNIRPVPFCLFDEVEAALDDANVEAFGKYLDKYRDNTQFIIITHKKKTMEYADILYGITMEESGVSKIVSVKLEDIKKD